MRYLIFEKPDYTFLYIPKCSIVGTTKNTRIYRTEGTYNVLLIGSGGSVKSLYERRELKQATALSKALQACFDAKGDEA